MKLFNKKPIIILIALSLLLSLTGCNTKAKAKGENDISAHIGGNIKTIDPSLCTDSDGMTFIVQCFEGLMTTDSNSEIVCGQAKNYMKVSDGKKVTAHDFVYSWRRLVDPATAS